MFDRIAYKYDFMNNLISFGIHKFIKKDSIKNLIIKSNSKALDLCCGTGDISWLLSKEKNIEKVFGVDFSKNMLKIANKKNKNEKITYKLADCTNLPFEDETFDICTIFFGLRNIEDKEKCLLEISRVIKKDGLLLNLDFVKNNSITFKLYSFFVSFTTKLFGNNSAYIYLLKSIKKYYTQQELTELFKKHKFSVKKIKTYAFENISGFVCRKRTS